MTNAIETSNLRYRAGKHFQISDLSLTVGQGSVYGFLGPNGSGKTTTIRLLMGLHKPLGGNITMLGRTVPDQITGVLERTGYVPERPHLYPSLTVAEAVRHHAAFHKRWDEAWADDLFDRFALVPDQRIGRLSKGEVGKLMMLFALGQRPELLVLDEPTEGLDPVVRREMMTAVLDYVGEQGATVLISSHLVHELERFCDWVGIMDQGRLVAEMPMDRFKQGMKKLRIADPPAVSEFPFEILMRESVNGGAAGEMWLVRGWESGMNAAIETTGATLREIVDLDLEDGFVELLRAFRAEQVQ